jgi:dolichol kinase
VRSLVIDFYVTLLWPLILLAVIALWYAIQGYRWPTKELSERKPFDEGEELVNWRYERRDEKDKAKNLIWFFSVMFVLLCAVMFTPDRWKIEVAYQFWTVLWFASGMALIILVPTAWHYARALRWWKLIACLLAILMAAASTEHFYHQKINSGKITCPQCDDDDDQPDDN